MVRMGPRPQRPADAGVDMTEEFLPMLIDGPWLLALAQGFRIPLKGIEVGFVQWNAGRPVMLMVRDA